MGEPWVVAPVTRPANLKSKSMASESMWLQKSEMKLNKARVHTAAAQHLVSQAISNQLICALCGKKVRILMRQKNAHFGRILWSVLCIRALVHRCVTDRTCVELISNRRYGMVKTCRALDSRISCFGCTSNKQSGVHVKVPG